LPAAFNGQSSILRLRESKDHWRIKAIANLLDHVVAMMSLAGDPSVAFPSSDMLDNLGFPLGHGHWGQ
jgi:hypothetical protein